MTSRRPRELDRGRPGPGRRVPGRHAGPAPCRGRGRGRARATSPGATGTSRASCKRWHGQFSKSTVDGAPGPAVIDRVHELLASRIPDQQGVAIVHGDYRLDNTVLDDEGNVIAILDWEICTLGDPLADLGLLLGVLGRARGRRPGALSAWPRPRCRASPAGRLVARYADGSGRDVSAVALLPGVRVLEARLHPPGRLRPLRRGGRGRRPLRRRPVRRHTWARWASGRCPKWSHCD